MRALIDEVQSLLPGIQDADAVDALIIASVQAIEHHQIALYGTTHTWAEQLGLSEDAAVLQSTLMDLTQAEALLPNIDGQEVGSQMAHPRDVEVHINSGGLAERAQRALGLTVRGSAAHPSGRSAGGP
jgi:ferritin-like metal-binding protein YciE